MHSRKIMIPTLLAASLLTYTASAADLFNNGGLNPTSTTGSGVTSMPGTRWSELQNDGSAAVASTGSTCNGNFRIADDFTVPAGGWTIREIAVYAYQTNNVAQTINGMNIQIWNGPPNAGGAVVFGDTTTNRLNTVVATNLIRTFSTSFPAAASPTVLRRPYEFRAIIETAPGVGLTLPAGTYWIDFQLVQNTNLAAASIFSPTVTVPGARNRPTDNALQSNTGVWAAVVDTGNPATFGSVPLDFPFIIRSTVTPASCAQDINGDGQVGVADLLAVITAWGACPTP